MKEKLFIVFVLISCLTTFSQNGKPGPSITDVEGNSYKTVFIGTKQWMADIMLNLENCTIGIQ